MENTIFVFTEFNRQSSIFKDLILTILTDSWEYNKSVLSEVLENI